MQSPEARKSINIGVVALEEWKWAWSGQEEVNRGRRLGSRGGQGQVMIGLWPPWGQ